MDFTYAAYSQLMELLRIHSYHFCSYHNYGLFPKCVILRHDVDNSLDAALALGKLESSQGITSTYFVLLSSSFYNVFSSENTRTLKQLQQLGHEIGLHFDETCYGEPLTPAEMISAIQKEATLLSAVIDTNITTVSMHRPSKTILNTNLHIPGIINSYGSVFFHDFKYISDSRRHWREPVKTIIESEQFKRLHILTHAFWYHEQDIGIKETVKRFINLASLERYNQMSNNITDLHLILKKEEIDTSNCKNITKDI